MLEINFWVWSSAGSVGLKFPGPSAKLLITLIIFNFVRSDPLSSTYFDSRFNSPKENRYRPSKRNYKSPHLVSHSGFQLFQVEPRLSIWKRMPSTLLPVRFWNVCLWQFFVCFNAFTTFWYYTKKNHVFLREWYLYSSRGLVGKKTFRCQIFLLVLDEWTTVKFEHCVIMKRWKRACFKDAPQPEVLLFPF